MSIVCSSGTCKLVPTPEAEEATAAKSADAPKRKFKAAGRSRSKSQTPEHVSGEESKSVTVTPEYVRTLQGPTDDYLCGLEANVYGINFTYFKIREVNSGVQVFEVAKGEDEKDQVPVRYIRYTLPPAILDFPSLAATVRFTVEKEVRDFVMIERHYFRNRLLKEFEFKFPFCIPGSTNTIEQVYEVPALSAQEKEELIENPYETKSDSFYFVEGVLVMHNRADYAYNTEHYVHEQEQEV